MTKTASTSEPSPPLVIMFTRYGDGHEGECLGHLVFKHGPSVIPARGEHVMFLGESFTVMERMFIYGTNDVTLQLVVNPGCMRRDEQLIRMFLEMRSARRNFNDKIKTVKAWKQAQKMKQHVPDLELEEI